MPDAFDDACTYLIKNEGGATYTDQTTRPNDRGGPTKYGITQATLLAWRSLQAGKPVAVLAADVKALTELEARAIYRKLFWAPLRLGEVTNPMLARGIFDMSAPVGVGAAAKVLQTCAGTKPDGLIGPVTVAAINALDPEVLLVAFSTAMLTYFRAIPKRLPDQRPNLPGWLKRAVLLQALLP